MSVTTVSATLTDPNGVAFKSARVVAQFVPAAGSQLHLWQGGPVPDTLESITNSSGVLSIILPDNSKITPTGSKWKFFIIPSQGAAAYSPAAIVISGTSQSVTSELTTGAPVIVNQSVDGQIIQNSIITPAYLEITTALVSTLPATTGNYGNFFVANRAYEVVSARESHTVAGSDAGAVTLDIEKLTAAQALDAGVSVLAGTFNLKSTANTPVAQTPSATEANRKLAAGDRLALKDAGVLTAVAGLAVTITLKAL